MEKNNIATSVNQSLAIRDILPIETADMYYAKAGLEVEDERYALFPGTDWVSQDDVIPAWSFHALVNALPDKIKYNDKIYHLIISHDDVAYFDDDNVHVIVEGDTYGTFIDMCFSLISHRYAQKMHNFKGTCYPIDKMSYKYHWDIYKKYRNGECEYPYPAFTFHAIDKTSYKCGFLGAITTIAQDTYKSGANYVIDVIMKVIDNNKNPNHEFIKVNDIKTVINDLLKEKE